MRRMVWPRGIDRPGGWFGKLRSRISCVMRWRCNAPVFQRQVEPLIHGGVGLPRLLARLAPGAIPSHFRSGVGGPKPSASAPVRGHGLTLPPANIMFRPN
jgi:hypothetical protein